jgi:hypothetical protein
LFDGENISFDASLVIYINSTDIPPIMIINRICEHQNLLSLWLVSFLVGLRIYQHPVNIREFHKFMPSYGFIFYAKKRLNLSRNRFWFQTCLLF